MHTSTGYAFPSGHTQGASTVFTSTALWLKKRWMLVTAYVVTFLVAISRLYLGVHYLSDVVVGAILGIGLSFLMVRFFQKSGNPEKAYKYILYGSLAFLLIVFVYHILTIEAESGMTDAETFYDRMEGGFKMTGSMIGFVLGIAFENKHTRFTHTKVIWKNLIRFGLGVAVVMGVRIGLSVGIRCDYRSGTLGQLANSFRRLWPCCSICFATSPWSSSQLAYIR
ncbi:MAG: phosphatase PAP2 family protein [Bacillus subtilis]|nr:phosphatase PAP2 family protein [Bacillus subtilis]